MCYFIIVVTFTVIFCNLILDFFPQYIGLTKINKKFMLLCKYKYSRIINTINRSSNPILNFSLVKPIIIALLILSILSPIYSGLKKRINRDGTIEYSNRKILYKQRRTKFIFHSPYNSLIEKISKNYGVDPYLVKCIIKVESNFKADAVSVAGAMGLMQIMQHIAHYYHVHDPLSPKENLEAGIRHFRSLQKYFNNDNMLALAAYHAGIGRVRKKMKVPPIKSTIDYVEKVLYYYNNQNRIDAGSKIKKLYKRIKRDGTIEIHD